MQHLFGPWLRSFSKKQMSLVVIGVAALCWAIWISRNDLVFKKSQYVSVLQVIFRGVFGSEVGLSLLMMMGGIVEGRRPCVGVCRSGVL
jgi:hypothetical protein